MSSKVDSSPDKKCLPLTSSNVLSALSFLETLCRNPHIKVSETNSEDRDVLLEIRKAYHQKRTESKKRKQPMNKSSVDEPKSKKARTNRNKQSTPMSMSSASGMGSGTGISSTNLAALTAHVPFPTIVALSPHNPNSNTDTNIHTQQYMGSPQHGIKQEKKKGHRSKSNKPKPKLLEQIVEPSNTTMNGSAIQPQYLNEFAQKHRIRGNSPSEWSAVDCNRVAAHSFLPYHQEINPGRSKMDHYLNAISSIYYHPLESMQCQFAPPPTAAAATSAAAAAAAGAVPPMDVPPPVPLPPPPPVMAPGFPSSYHQYPHTSAAGPTAVLPPPATLAPSIPALESNGTDVPMNAAYPPTQPLMDYSFDTSDIADSGGFRFSTLDLLLSPMRKRSPIENWSAREVALFESAICCKGKDFYEISKVVGTKNTKEVINFYYHWKSSSHYRTWKALDTQTTKYASNRRKLHLKLAHTLRGFYKNAPVTTATAAAMAASAAAAADDSVMPPDFGVPSSIMSHTFTPPPIMPPDMPPLIAALNAEESRHKHKSQSKATIAGHTTQTVIPNIHSQISSSSSSSNSGKRLNEMLVLPPVPLPPPSSAEETSSNGTPSVATAAAVSSDNPPTPKQDPMTATVGNSVTDTKE